jgi:hypothetical protein
MQLTNICGDIIKDLYELIFLKKIISQTVDLIDDPFSTLFYP